MKYGYFSETAAAEYGTTFWHTPTGAEIEVTCVGSHQRPRDGKYFFDDAHCVGEVTTWSRMGTPTRNAFRSDSTKFVVPGGRNLPMQLSDSTAAASIDEPLAMASARLAEADALARTLAGTGTVPERCRTDFLRLTRTLLHGPRFQWLIVEAHSDQSRAQLLGVLERVVETAGWHSSRLPLGDKMAGVPELETELERQASSCAVVHVLGQPGWFDTERWNALNVRRERLAARAAARLVFWLDADTIAQAACDTPDLWSWRSGLYTLDEPPVLGDHDHGQDCRRPADRS